MYYLMVEGTIQYTSEESVQYLVEPLTNDGSVRDVGGFRLRMEGDAMISSGKGSLEFHMNRCLQVMIPVSHGNQAARAGAGKGSNIIIISSRAS